MRIAETVLMDGHAFWGDVRLDSKNRQTLLLSARRAGREREGFHPVFEMTVINGQLAFCTYKYDGRINDQGLVGSLESSSGSSDPSSGTQSSTDDSAGSEQASTDPTYQRGRRE